MLIEIPDSADARGLPRAQQVEQIVRTFARFARPVMRLRWGADSCIASVRVTQLVLKRMGLRVRPLPVTSAVFNPPLVQYLLRHGEMPEGKYEELGCWGVMCGTPHEDQSNETDYDAHLVALVDRTWIVDMSLDQFRTRRLNYPDLPDTLVSLPIEGTTGIPEEDGIGEPFVEHYLETGGLVTYAHIDRHHYDGPDWRDANRFADVVEVLTTTLRTVTGVKKIPPRR